MDLASKTITVAGKSFAFSMPEGPRQQFLEGRWDGAAELLAAQDRIRETADRIPYFRDFT